jgi:serine/threonine protein kinase
MDDDALYEKLRDAIMEAGSLRQEAYEETRRRQKAERDLADASRMVITFFKCSIDRFSYTSMHVSDCDGRVQARDAESSWQGEASRRKEMEERLARERAAMEQDRRELDAILEKIREVDSRSAELELQTADSERAMGEVEARMAESCSVLDALRLERRREEPSADEESIAAVAAGGVDRGVGFLRLDLSQLEEATGHFAESARIGGTSRGGGRGGVYRGTLRGITVAVTVIRPDVAVGEARFARAMDAMARARHPGLVTLVGACPQASAVVHELVPGGSLEDRIGDDAPAQPLPWHARCGVAYRTCSTLAFLHSTGTAHGDVRLANILFEDERGSSSKIAGLGMRMLVAAPKRAEDMALAYVDPRWLATGEEPTPQCDVHALGVVLLRMVTGMPAFAAKKATREAAAGDRAWHDVVDAGGGGWPMERATEVALLGLRCCDGMDGDEVPTRRGPEELLEEARGVLEAATSAAPGRTWSSLSSSSDGGAGAPSYFLCPILKVCSHSITG